MDAHCLFVCGYGLSLHHARCWLVSICERCTISSTGSLSAVAAPCHCLPVSPSCDCYQFEALYIVWRHSFSFVRCFSCFHGMSPIRHVLFSFLRPPLSPHRYIQSTTTPALSFVRSFLDMLPSTSAPTSNIDTSLKLDIL